MTDARYKPGVGVLYEGEVDDPEIADLVRNGRVDVSPFVIRRLGERDEQRDALQAEEILHWRDLAVVSNGASEGASIEPAPSAAEAMSNTALADALGAAFEDGGAEGDEGDDGGAQPDDESAESDATPDDPAGDDADTTPTGDDPGDGASTLGPDDPTPSMDLTDSEEDLVRTARTLDDPSVVEADVEALADEMETYDDPHVVEAEDYDALAERVETVRSVLADALAERTGMQTSTAEALSLDNLMAEFETDDGEFDAEALVQSPETGSTDDDPADPNGGDVGADDGVDALSEDEREEIRSKLARADTLNGVNSSYAESLREEAAEAAGVDSYDDIDMEAL
ncbi:hypothetical protein [Halopelagius fulvigenes]|uniref:Uncharacterized protein n=1 Tax=Halopelagius fulvigenes TaxID=1198324 RepID=A0ABD5TYJ8_9EURY